MWIRRTVALMTAVAFGCVSTETANAHWSRHHRGTHALSYVSKPAEQAAHFGGRLVLHPASNIACMTPFQSTRALPCDQPVWVYGSPCEVDLGLGRSRPCH
jgi:hypothetical protein